jgi:cyclic beta-1,2-glucan synthetase
MQLPGLELSAGVPPEFRTIIVIPTLLTSPAAIAQYIERLEVHYLANPDENFTFALLTDWMDSVNEHESPDDELVATALAGISELNERHPRAGGTQRFLLLHRRRVWNESEGKWIGWERKRGKLHELNRLLRGETDTSFVKIAGAAQALPDRVRYVLTLDADTRLSIGAARQLVGKISHPLNRPVIDWRLGCVIRGHGILQPRVTQSLPIGAGGSLFQRIYSGPNGLDPYAVVVSDVYQDLYGEGSYVGKGIYDIDAFEAALSARIPANTVLSHDLLEGIFARAALASDIEVIEEYPSHYEVAAARQQRWVRGDWQLLPWIFRNGPRASKRRSPIPLSGRWRLIDNLRRSLVPPATLLAILLGWLLPLWAATAWTLALLLAILVPTLLPVISALLPRRPSTLRSGRWRGIRRDVELGVVQCSFVVTFLAHQSWLMVDAIGRTLFRVVVSRRHLLEWVTTAQTSSEDWDDRRSLISQIAASTAFATVVGLVVVFAGRGAWPIALPFGILWVLSPVAARWSSAPPPSAGHLTMKPSEFRALRSAARRTWRFFETFITEEDNFLPPDNFQEDPAPVVAHRTSPTNIGLYLLSVAAARDFGWIGTLECVERLERSFVTLEKLERFRGHIFNWYDTRDLRPLEPRYISSVDSGNLAGMLITLANACREFGSRPALNPAWKLGLTDALDVFCEHARAAYGERNTRDVQYAEIIAATDDISELLKDETGSADDALDVLDVLAKKAEHLVTITAAQHDSAAPAQTDNSDLSAWAQAISASISSHKRDIELCTARSGVGSVRDGHATAPPMRDWRASVEATKSDQDGELALLSKPPHVAVSDASEEGANNVAQGTTKTLDLLRRAAILAERAIAMVHEMEFGFLLDPGRQLLSIGFRSTDASRDTTFYDLLASEARLASFIAIAKGDVSAKHWFHLGRTMTPVPGGSALISWSGSMFEYLMPSLVMRAPDGSLLAETNKMVVRRQESYAAELGVPWGISESAYNARDMERTYQYSSFGIPDLGYKRGLADNTVVAPYATALAAMIDPAGAARNLAHLAEAGGRGRYGWYEALDYTRSRIPEGANVAVVRCFMAHHQAMSLLAIANAVHDGAMRARFHAEPMIQAAELLLQERMPRNVAVARPTPEQVAETIEIGTLVPDIQRRYTSAYSRLPRTQLLSNGRFATMVTAAGSGYTRWGEIAITRWREDVTCDNWGSFCFVRDVASGDIWSTGYQPTVAKPDRYIASFTEDRAEIVRRDGSITTVLEIAVSPEDDAEVRRVSLTNHGTRTRELELTSYCELSLARQSDDMAHPAFAKMFVETEFEQHLGALLATRRKRSPNDPNVWVSHVAVVEGGHPRDVQFETDRNQFLGRGQTIRDPAAIAEGWPLSNTTGAVLDPILSLRRRVRVSPGATVHVSFWTMVGATRDDAVALAEKHLDAAAFERAMTLAWTQAQMQLHNIGISSGEAQLYQRLANHVLYSDPTLRPPPDFLKRNARKVSTFWPHGISGDLPIVLARIEQEDDLELVRQLLRAHEYWKLKQLEVDLVFLNERATSYAQDFHSSVEALVRMNQAMPRLAQSSLRGNVYLFRADLLSGEVRDALQSAARAVLHGQLGSLVEQINRARERRPGVAPAVRKLPQPVASEPAMADAQSEFYNGIGGFVQDGREYLTQFSPGQRTPAPWINVVANASFGFQVSAEGSGYTWSANSQQNQLTPWSNDPVSDAPGEAIYLRDEENGALWTPTALPIRQKGARYSAAHGQGYSRFEHTSHGIALQYLQFVPVDDSIKIARLTVTNQSGKIRKLSVTAYVEWLLGSSQRAGRALIVTEIDPETGALFAQNPWGNDFGERVAFIDMMGRQSGWTGDRTEFIGRDGALDRPAALAEGVQLSNRVGAGMDPCGVLKTGIALGPVETMEIVILIGQGSSRKAATELIRKYRKANLDDVLAKVRCQWDEVLGAVRVKTPDRALDTMVNRWLLYQTLSCRVWARAGFYQVSGAFGFRDQLQDVMALCIARPDIAREHLLRAAGRQFAQGDVQHWWLPENGRGIRTRVSDDRVWLAYAAAHYVEITADAAVLDESIPFLDGSQLQPQETESFFQPSISSTAASLFEHCALALESSFATGSHGLPLMGSGDWNDGMNRIGEEGKGESVWLGWFLYSTLTSFAVLAENRGQGERAGAWRQRASDIKQSLERDGWDGDWYRRAYYDDGTPLGSVSNSECRIDSVAQSWAVISGAADRIRASRAMAAVDKYLLQRDQKLALLFTPPFDNPSRDPGYIKGYPPGMRENGGQYTHAALWASLAYTMLGDGDKAYEVLTMLNPIRHADSPMAIERFKIEPYVVPADVYSVPPHVGRGGWSWYTGSASWFYRVSLERILGFRRQGSQLLIDPCIPQTWPGFSISYRFGTATYDISVENPLGVCTGVLAVKVDGQTVAGNQKNLVALTDDGKAHRILVVLG